MKTIDSGIAEQHLVGTNSAEKKSAETKVVLPPNYYLNNFSELVNFVVNVYSDLLSSSELDWYRVFDSLPVHAQQLYIRLLCRTKSLFRHSRLNYPEIEQLTSAASILSECKFLEINPTVQSAELISLFKREELLELLQLPLPKQTRRADIDAYILDQLEETDVAHQLTNHDVVYQVLREDEFSIFRLCFFGNLYQDMTDFVLRDLGLTRYESYPINNNTRAFGCRQQLERHSAYFQCSEQIDSAVEQGAEAILELYEKLQASALNQGATDAVLSRRCDRLILRLARQLERIEEFEAALKLYGDTQRPPSRERRARIFFKQGQSETALKLCQQILTAPRNEEELEFARQFGRRVAKSVDKNWLAVERFIPEKLELELEKSEHSVEIITAKYFESSGVCYYTENTLFNGVFGLAFWSVVFAPIEGVFFNRFQTAPADFHESDFPHTRQALIDELLAGLSSRSDLQALVWTHWNQKFGIQNPLVNWRYLNEELLEIAMQRITMEHWLAIFRRQLSDIRQNRAGFPDLIFFPESGGYQLIEVKGPGDTVQKNQLRWMRYFKQEGIPCCVAHVRWKETAGTHVDVDPS